MRIGVDIGGTKIEVGALDDRGQILARRRAATPAGDYDGTIALVCELIRETERDVGQAGTVGVGMPGALSPATGLVKNSNSTILNHRPFDRDLIAALGRPVRFANDANCFALSEAVDGAGRGARIVFGAILGTGVGGGIVIDGRILAGANAIGGEWGHSSLPWPEPSERPGPLCYCGKHGCIEAFLSGPSLARDHRDIEGEDIDAATLAARDQESDAAAGRSLARYEDRLARALAGVINLIDPDVIVLGGGVGQITRLYQNVPRRWGAFVFYDEVVTRLEPPRWGASSGVRGAAWLWEP
jgi:fructokinase